MDDHNDDNRNHEHYGIAGAYAFLTEFESCHDELSLFAAQILMEFEPSEEVDRRSHRDPHRRRRIPRGCARAIRRRNCPRSSTSRPRPRRRH